MRLCWEEQCLAVEADATAQCDPEVAFWHGLAQQPCAEYRAPAGSSVIGTVMVTYRVGHGPRDLEYRLKVRFWPGYALRWVGRAPHRPVLHALYRLLAAWPETHWRLLPAKHGEVGIQVDIIRQWAADPDLGPAVVATALWNVLDGLEPEEAIRKAHAEPLELPGGRPAGQALEASWRLGTVRLPADLAWLNGTALGNMYRRGALLDGFRIEVASDTLMGRLRRYRAERGTWVRARSGSRWLPLSWLAVHWGERPIDARPSVEVWVDAKLAPVSVPRDDAVRTVLRAWPDGEKALLVSRDILWTPGIIHWDFAVAAVRLGTADATAVQAVVDHALKMAAAGQNEGAIRSWLAGLSTRDVEAVAALAKLAR